MEPCVPAVCEACRGSHKSMVYLQTQANQWHTLKARYLNAAIFIMNSAAPDFNHFYARTAHHSQRGSYSPRQQVGLVEQIPEFLATFHKPNLAPATFQPAYQCRVSLVPAV